jgi:hypothetical protein
MGANSLSLRPFSFLLSPAGQRVSLTADLFPRQDSVAAGRDILTVHKGFIIRAKAKIYCELKKPGPCAALWNRSSIYNLGSAAVPLFIPMKIS